MNNQADEPGTYREKLRATLAPHEQAQGDGADAAWLHIHCNEVQEPREPDNADYMRSFSKGYELMASTLRSLGV